MSVYKTGTQIPPSIATDAAFRLIGKWISDQLAAAGFVKTGDTGQIDWTTVLTPNGTANLKRGYEIWRFDDTLQATKPIFFRIDYGSGDSSSGFGIWMTTGEGSDGAGTITGIAKTSVTKVTPGANGSTNEISSRFAADMADGWFVCAMWTDGLNASSSHAFAFSIERSRDANGSPTGTYAFETSVLSVNAFTAQGIICLELGVGISARQSTPAFPGGQDGSVCQPGLCWPQDGVFVGPLLTFVMWLATTVAAGSSVSFTHYGATRRYAVMRHPMNSGGSNRNHWGWVTNDTLYFSIYWPE